jgi:predicted nucleic acid-binding protein
MSDARLVVDASAVAKWFLCDEQLLPEADALRRDVIGGSVALVAPVHLPLEVTNALVRAHRRGRMTLGDLTLAVSAFGKIIADVEVIAANDLIEPAATFCLRLGTGFFDACYLVAARHVGVPLVTADAVFYRQVQGEPDVRWLDDYGVGA